MGSQGTARWGCSCRWGPLCLTLTPIGPTGTWALSFQQSHTARRRRAEAITAAQRWPRWRLALSQGSPGACAESSRSAQLLGRAVAQPPPIMLRILCGNRARIPGPCTYSHQSAFPLFGCRAGRVSVGPGKWGCVSVQEGVAASRVGAAAPPCWYRLCAPNRSSLGRAGLGPGHRGGSSGDMLDTGLEEQAWLGTARAGGRWHLPRVQPGMWGSVRSRGHPQGAPRLALPSNTLSWFAMSE